MTDTSASETGLPSEAEVFRAMHDLLEGIAQVAESHGFQRGDDLQVWLATNLLPAQHWPVGSHFRIGHDGFEGSVIGHYTRLDGKRGVVGQQAGTNIVHVYGEKWLQPTEADGNKPS